MSKIPYKWARAGDVNAFFGLMLDNIAGLVLTVSLLFFTFGFPVEFALAYMVPGTAIGVLLGDLLYFFMAFQLAKKENRSDVCAMPLGLDTPSTIGMIFFVLGPAFVFKTQALASQAGLDFEVLKNAVMDESATVAMVEQFSQIQHDAAIYTWHIGICALLLTGVIKLIFAYGANWLKDSFPRAGLLGSLAAIALALIGFIQFQKMCDSPIVGFASMGMIILTLLARGKLPGRVPGALAAVGLGCALHYMLRGVEGFTDLALLPAEKPPLTAEITLTAWFEAWTFGWVEAFNDSLTYLPYVIPFAIATTIGGIDCAESAASAGDDFDTRKVIGVEAISTIVASLCGGVIQNTPYIGHPAYKAMGARAAYVLATALFVGGAGLLGYFKYIFVFLPEVAVLPILVFIGLEITGQSFIATPKRHYAALAIAFIPALAKLIIIYLDQYLNVLLGPGNVPAAMGDGRLEGQYMLLRMLAGGFIISSLIWAAATAKLIDRKLNHASIYFAIAGMLTLFGVVHSPLEGEKMFLPWTEAMQSNPDFARVVQFAIGYFVLSVVLLGVSWFMRNELTPITTDEEFEALE
jgi:AGZA family xanthine/uracil permease-like MFS transporter